MIAETLEKTQRLEIDAVVCVPTFRRPDMLRKTLASIQAQNGALRLAVVVVDNDAKASEGAAAAQAIFLSGALLGVAVVEPEPGHCSAVNRSFSEARKHWPKAEFYVMIDDDETADPDWARRLIAAARVHSVDLVGGPVTPVFSDKAPGNLERHPVYWPAFDVSGPVPMIYGSGNFLIRADAFAKLDNGEFDPRYNFLGGGDTDFFARCRRAGLTSYWENDARIVETVPAERLRANWVVRRSLRIGAINFRLDRASVPGVRGHVKAALKNVVILPLSVLRAARDALRGRPVLTALHPILVAFGRLFAWAGIEPEQYRLGR